MIFWMDLRCSVFVCFSLIRATDTVVSRTISHTCVCTFRLYRQALICIRSAFHRRTAGCFKDKPAACKQCFLSGYRAGSEGAYDILDNAFLPSIPLRGRPFVVRSVFAHPDKPRGAGGGEGRQVSRGTGLGEQGAGRRGESVMSTPSSVLFGCCARVLRWAGIGY